MLKQDYLRELGLSDPAILALWHEELNWDDYDSGDYSDDKLAPEHMKDGVKAGFSTLTLKFKNPKTEDAIYNIKFHIHPDGTTEITFNRLGEEICWMRLKDDDVLEARHYGQRTIGD